MGQNIIFGVMNIVHFCHGEMLMVGMYITYVRYTYFGVDPYVALPIVAVLMFGLGALIQSTLITPSLKPKSFTNLLFLTVGLGLLLTKDVYKRQIQIVDSAPKNVLFLIFPLLKVKNPAEKSFRWFKNRFGCAILCVKVPVWTGNRRA